MDRLIDDYEKALTEEFELREPVHKARWELKGFEALQMVRIVTDEPKLPQWKAKEIHEATLHQDPEYWKAAAVLREAELAHGKADIRATVALERLKLTRARLYGGHHEMLDMQEVAQAPRQALD